MRTHVVNFLFMTILISALCYGCTTQFPEPIPRPPESPTPQASRTPEPLVPPKPLALQTSVPQSKTSKLIVEKVDQDMILIKDGFLYQREYKPSNPPVLTVSDVVNGHLVMEGVSAITLGGVNLAYSVGAKWTFDKAGITFRNGDYKYTSRYKGATIEFREDGVLMKGFDYAPYSLESETDSPKKMVSGKQAKTEGEPRIKTSLNLDRLDVMEIIGQSESQLPKWDLSYAKGAYSQELKETKAAGEIIDLGGLKLTNGKEYPFLMVEGKVLVWHNESDTEGKQSIEKTTNQRGFTINNKENVWNSADGKVTITQLEGVCGLVLDPKGFPRDLKVVGVSDSKFMYLYPSE